MKVMLSRIFLSILRIRSGFSPCKFKKNAISSDERPKFFFGPLCRSLTCIYYFKSIQRCIPGFFPADYICVANNLLVFLRICPVFPPEFPRGQIVFHGISNSIPLSFGGLASCRQVALAVRDSRRQRQAVRQLLRGAPPPYQGLKLGPSEWGAAVQQHVAWFQAV